MVPYLSSEYDYKAGAPLCRVGHQREPSLSNWLAVLYGSLEGIPPPAGMSDGNRCSILYRPTFDMGLHMLTFGMGLHMDRTFS